MYLGMLSSVCECEEPNTSLPTKLLHLVHFCERSPGSLILDDCIKKKKPSPHKTICHYYATLQRGCKITLAGRTMRVFTVCCHCIVSLENTRTRKYCSDSFSQRFCASHALRVMFPSVSRKVFTNRTRCVSQARRLNQQPSRCDDTRLCNSLNCNI